jgi:hypothetical protein
MARTDTVELFRLKMPIRKNLKSWLQKWLGQSGELTVTMGVNEIGKMVSLACVEGAPSPNEKPVSCAGLDDFLYVLIPKGSYIPQKKIVELNDTLYEYLISQMVSVALAKKYDFRTPQAAVLEYYESYFGLEMTNHALEKASQRLRSQRNIPRFLTRK